MEYFELETVVDEWGSDLVSRWATLEQAKSDMTNRRNWWGETGTGTIYKVTIKVLPDGQIDIDREKVYQVK